MATIYPFRGLRPKDELVERVASVPYDVVNREEAKALAEGNPHSFLHVTKAEIDLPADLDPHSDEVYQKGADTLRQMIDDGVLVRDAEPCLYAYALTMDGRTQTGIALLASVEEYDQNLVRKHEHTRPDKEQDRAHHIEVLGCQSGVVFLVHRDHAPIAEVLATVTAATPQVDFTAPDGIRHQLWVISDDAQIDGLVNGFASAGPLYIADGHHRSAAASRVAAKRRNQKSSLKSFYEGFIAVSFPESELRILPYNRVVKDLGQRDPETFLAAVKERFDVTDGKPEPIARGQFGMLLGKTWYTLTTREGTIDPDDPVARLDVSILQSQLLAPLLGIDDPRRDQRIDFVGGIRGDEELERRIDAGWAVAFKMHPTAMSDLLAIADAEEVMPPKSTWFEPKLRDGLVVHLI